MSYNIIYFSSVIILTSGLFIMLVSGNYVRKLIGLSIFQSAILIFYIALGKVKGGGVPILNNELGLYTSPLPHVLMLTAIVVGFATLSVGLALVYRIHKQYKTLSEKDVNEHF